VRETLLKKMLSRDTGQPSVVKATEEPCPLESLCHPAGSAVGKSAFADFPALHSKGLRYKFRGF
jgi:hypothetical protein